MNLNTCESHDHAVVVFEGVTCPACELILELTERIREVEHDRDRLEAKVEELENQVEALDLENERLKEITG